MQMMKWSRVVNSTRLLYTQNIQCNNKLTKSGSWCDLLAVLPQLLIAAPLDSVER
ncbi:hypothetical protein M5D96_002882 [Drosophila gunungcola]|uniref:Uncharacterized protein n=1 Tax=Drosophila gunungcola TaxID=103775 RepID=A0A9Q0BWW4_9MUSC|nr:hypothetical protein M5D96_002882 [Drosophila gunungcola]